jgi:membrane-associated phospholipid phosphatase
MFGAPREPSAVTAGRSAQHARPHALLVRAEQAAPPLGARVKAAIAPPLGGLLRLSAPATRPATSTQPLQSQKEPQQVKQHQQQAPGVPAQPSLAARPATTAGALAVFAAVAAAVFGPLRPLEGLDAAAHAWVAAHTTAEWRLTVGEHVISDGPIAAALMLGWLLPSAAALAAAPRRAAPPLAAAWLAYGFGAGISNPIDGSDPWLVHALKTAFARVRPSVEIHQTFSFPSGHTTAAAFMAGAALFVLLPLAARLAAGRRLRLPDAAALPLWAGCVAATAAGRVAADCHWVSDTLAGAALGIACASGLAVAVEWLTAIEEAAGGAGQQAAAADQQQKARQPGEQ